MISKKNISFSFVIFSVCLLSTAQALFVFQDENQIPAWAKTSIEAVREASVMTGFADGTFGPDKILNRAEALAILLRVKGIDYQNRELDTPFWFSDVPEDQWYTKIIHNGVHEGWIQGFPDGSFGPGNPVNKAELATMIQRAFDLQEDENPGYRDVPITAWFAKPVFAVTANGLERNQSEYFNPSESVSRVDAAWIMAEIMGKPRLMGTSQEMNFASAVKRDSRYVAIKPRNFNPNNQGYDIERKVIRITPQPHAETVQMQASDEWIEVGTYLVENTMETTSKLDALELKLRMENGVGPVNNFRIKLEEPDLGIEKEIDVNSSGTAFFGGLEASVDAGQSRRFRISIQPISDMVFYAKQGDAWLYAYKAEGKTYTEFVSTNRDVNGFVFAPIDIEPGNIAHINFNPFQ